MTYDDALTALHHLDPQWTGFGSDRLQNHTTMVAHALHALGHEDRIGPRTSETEERYRPLRPATGRALKLGDGQVADWVQHWSTEIAREGWRRTLRAASRELAPGILAGSLHGWIRTGHATRALLERETEPRLRELAFGLAVWAAWYEELAPPMERAALPLDRLLAAVPSAGSTGEGLIDERASKAAAREEVRRWAGSMQTSDELQKLDPTDLTRAAAQALCATTPRSWGGLAHGLTATSLFRVMAPHVAEQVTPALVHAFGALLASHEQGETPTIAAPTCERLRDWAGRSEDDHVIKVIEACLREHDATGDALYLHAAARATLMREPESRGVLYPAAHEGDSDEGDSDRDRTPHRLR